MAKKTISLSNIINSNIHRPKTKNGFILYPKVKGYTGTSEGGELVTKAEQDPTYIAQSAKNYNSPTNIKKIFITGKSIYIQYHIGPIISAKSADKWTRVSISDPKSGLDLFEIAQKIATYDQDRHNFFMEKAINSGAVEPDQFIINGTLNMAAYPYSCSNLEELYFDWTLLLSPEISQYFTELTKGATPAQIAQNFLNFNGNFVTETQIPVNAFVAQSASGSKNIRKKFPRLREITFISNLENIMNMPEALNYDKTEKLGDVTKTWYEINEQLIKSTNTCTLRGNIQNDLKNPNTEFIVKNNMYVFDDKLDAFVKSYEDKVKEIIRQKRYGNTTDQELEDIVEMTDLEKRLLEIETKYDTKTMISIWQYAYAGAGLSKTEFEKVLRTFTKANRSRIAKSINITL